MSYNPYLNALIKNNSKVLKEIFDNNFYKVLGFVLKNKGQREDAEDVFQKALLQLAIRYKKEPFEIKTSFEAYLFTVCKNLWRRELNKRKFKVTNDGILELKDDSTDIAMAALEQERWELYNAYFEKLSDNCKQILKLFFKKTPYKDIVKRFNYNSETVARQRVFKCKNKLKTLISSDKRFNDLTGI